MNVIPLKRNLNFQEYQLVVSVLEEIGIEVETAHHFELNEEDLEKIKKSNEEAEKGLLISNDEVQRKALALCIK